MVVSDPMVMPAVLHLLECFEQELVKHESPPAKVQVRPGVTVAAYVSEVEDECCAGLAWVRPAGFAPVNPWPAPLEVPTAKGVQGWAVRLELGAVRCAPTGEHNVNPTGQQWLAVTQAVMDDAAAMRRAICCFTDTYFTTPQIGAQNVIPGEWQPIEVEGGCVGGFLTLLLRGPACDCADAGPES